MISTRIQWPGRGSLYSNDGLDFRSASNELRLKREGKYWTASIVLDDFYAQGSSDWIEGAIKICELGVAEPRVVPSLYFTTYEVRLGLNGRSWEIPESSTTTVYLSDHTILLWENDAEIHRSSLRGQKLSVLAKGVAFAEVRGTTAYFKFPSVSVERVTSKIKAPEPYTLEGRLV